MEEQDKLEQSEPGEIIDREYVQGFALSGDYVSELKDKHFAVVGQRTEVRPNFNNPEQTSEKLILSVKLIKDGAIIDYYPNKTSQKTIITQRGYRLNDWIGFEGEFFVENQKVGQNKRNVIYIVE